MRYKPGHKEEAHGKLVAAVGRGFREYGFGSIGVDGLAKAAQVTSGAFYGHFASKEAAFREAIEAGLEELRDGIATLRASHGAQWPNVFIDFYLGYKRTCELGDSCAAQTLTPEVGRASAALKATFETNMAAVIACIAEGLETGTTAERQAKAWSLMALLSGAVTLARAVNDPALSEAIAASARAAALEVLAGAGKP